MWEKLLIGGEVALLTGLFLMMGKGLEWIINRHVTTSKLVIDEEAAEDDRAGSVIARYRTLWQDERTRADQMEKDHSTAIGALSKRITDLEGDVARLKEGVETRNGVIAQQQIRITTLDRKVAQLTGNSESL